MKFLRTSILFFFLILTVSVLFAEENYNEKLDIAVDKIKNGRYEEAVNILKSLKYSENCPDRIKIVSLYNLAYIEYQKKNYKKSYEILESLINENPPAKLLVDIFIIEGNIAVNNGNYSFAAEKYKDAISVNPLSKTAVNNYKVAIRLLNEQTKTKTKGINKQNTEKYKNLFYNDNKGEKASVKNEHSKKFEKSAKNKFFLEKRLVKKVLRNNFVLIKETKKYKPSEKVRLKHLVPPHTIKKRIKEKNLVDSAMPRMELVVQKEKYKGTRINEKNMQLDVLRSSKDSDTKKIEMKKNNPQNNNIQVSDDNKKTLKKNAPTSSQKNILSEWNSLKEYINKENNNITPELKMEMANVIRKAEEKAKKSDSENNRKHKQNKKNPEDENNKLWKKTADELNSILNKHNGEKNRQAISKLKERIGEFTQLTDNNLNKPSDKPEQNPSKIGLFIEQQKDKLLNELENFTSNNSINSLNNENYVKQITEFKEKNKEKINKFSERLKKEISPNSKEKAGCISDLYCEIEYKFEKERARLYVDMAKLLSDLNKSGNINISSSTGNDNFKESLLKYISNLESKINLALKDFERESRNTYNNKLSDKIKKMTDNEKMSLENTAKELSEKISSLNEHKGNEYDLKKEIDSEFRGKCQKFGKQIKRLISDYNNQNNDAPVNKFEKRIDNLLSSKTFGNSTEKIDFYKEAILDSLNSVEKKLEDLKNLPDELKNDLKKSISAAKGEVESVSEKLKEKNLQTQNNGLSNRNINDNMTMIKQNIYENLKNTLNKYNDTSANTKEAFNELKREIEKMEKTLKKISDISDKAASEILEENNERDDIMKEISEYNLKTAELYQQLLENDNDGEEDSSMEKSIKEALLKKHELENKICSANGTDTAISDMLNSKQEIEKELIDAYKMLKKIRSKLLNNSSDENNNLKKTYEETVKKAENITDNVLKKLTDKITKSLIEEKSENINKPNMEKKEAKTKKNTQREAEKTADEYRKLLESEMKELKKKLSKLSKALTEPNSKSSKKINNNDKNKNNNNSDTDNKLFTEKEESHLSSYKKNSLSKSQKEATSQYNLYDNRKYKYTLNAVENEEKENIKKLYSGGILAWSKKTGSSKRKYYW